VIRNSLFNSGCQANYSYSANIMQVADQIVKMRRFLRLIATQANFAQANSQRLATGYPVW
jgi:hypothetical protein